MCRARLSWRSPPRLSRCRRVWPLEAGIGATPARRAKQASERSRPGCDQATISWAATIAPTPGSSSSVGARARTWARISRSSSVGLDRCGLDAAGEAAQHQPDGELVGWAVLCGGGGCSGRVACRAAAAQLVAERSGAVTMTRAAAQRFAADVDGAAAGDQQQPQCLASLPLPGQRERLAGQRRPRGPDGVERVVLAVQPPLRRGVRLISSTASPCSLRSGPARRRSCRALDRPGTPARREPLGETKRFPIAATVPAPIAPRYNSPRRRSTTASTCCRGGCRHRPRSPARLQASDRSSDHS